MTAARRPLRFATLDQILPDVDRLNERGHATMGKWTLGQIRQHLAGAVTSAALRLYAAHTGPMASHPFFGAIDRATWDRLHLIHCAHHLSFAVPTGLA